jgi:hypothetical protein
MAKTLRPYRLALMLLIFIGVLIGLGLLKPKTSTRQVSDARSPDGTTVAVLWQISRLGADTRGYEVCLQRPAAPPTTAVACHEVAYLGGVSDLNSQDPVHLLWSSPRQLEIHFQNASSVHVYQPVFVWGHSRGSLQVGTSVPILVKAVRTDAQDRPLPADPD